MKVTRKRTKKYDSTRYNFDRPHYNTREASAYLGCAEYTLRRSRSTGILFGRATPAYKKLGKLVI